MAMQQQQQQEANVSFLHESECTLNVIFLQVEHTVSDANFMLTDRCKKIRLKLILIRLVISLIDVFSLVNMQDPIRFCFTIFFCVDSVSHFIYFSYLFGLSLCSCKYLDLLFFFHI